MPTSPRIARRRSMRSCKKPPSHSRTVFGGFARVGRLTRRHTSESGGEPALACIFFEKRLTRTVGARRTGTWRSGAPQDEHRLELTVLKSFLVVAVAALFPLGASAQTGPDAGGAGKAAEEGSSNPGRPMCELSRAGAEEGGPRSEPAGDGAQGGQERDRPSCRGRPTRACWSTRSPRARCRPRAHWAREQVAAVRAWVEAGAPIRASRSPAPGRAGLVVAPADPAGLAAREWHGRDDRATTGSGRRSTPSSWPDSGPRGWRRPPRPTAATLIRRVTFDLTGLPPTPEEIDAFVSPRTPTRWPTRSSSTGCWLRRITASAGGGTGSTSSGSARARATRPTCRGRRLAVSRLRHPRVQPRHAVSPVRPRAARRRHARRGTDWLTQAATGFLVGGTHDIVGNQTVEGMLQQRADDLDDMITATGTTFLGLTIQCARCHDHKFDPITQKDYYGLQAIFAGVNHAERELPAPDAESRRREAAAVAAELARIEAAARCATSRWPSPIGDAPARPMVNPRRNVERFAPVPARMVRLTILATSRSDRAVPRRGRGLYDGAARRRRPPRNVALASAGGKASASSEYPERGDPQDRSPERRPARQRPELDLARAGQGECHDRLAGAGDDRPRRLGPRPRGGLPRPPGDRVLHRGGPRAGPVAGRRLVARSRPVSTPRPRRPRPAAASRVRAGSRASRVARAAGRASRPARRSWARR